MYTIKTRILFLYKCNNHKGFQKMNQQIEKQIGNNIRTIREQKGMTQEILSAKLQLRGCDITRSALAKIEVGQRHLYPDEILLIKEILETSFESIFYGN